MESLLGVTQRGLTVVTIGICWLSAALKAVLYVMGEVNTTTNKKGSFGGYGIQLDEHLATVLGGREGQKISPSEMTKRLWQYIKSHHLGAKN